MTDNGQIYHTGDWIVHRAYGVGQVVGLDKKCLNEKVQQFYKVRTNESTFWLPVNKAVSERVAPLPSKRMVLQAINVLQKKPQEMSSDFKTRKKRVEQVISGGSLIAISRLVRDLTARQKEIRLSFTEAQALRRLKGLLFKVWSVRLRLEPFEVYRRFLDLLKPPSAAKMDIPQL
jgi:RNA polymerase-interacting CarD/CdnL/TRCF family regulator